MRRVVDLDADHPAVAVGVFVDLLGRIVEALVYFDHRAANRHVYLADSLDAFNRPEGLGRFKLIADFRQLYIHDIAELMLSVIGDAHGRLVPFGADPFMVFGVAEIFRCI